ncbi:hypothetical protein [Tsuneonella troitsensis]|jgi:hypothetical protein|uniref:hypothetical protein n=1 Tax=Tsuneonella troitsensis TaxID=292222 RepID=UPI0007097D0A|nr:hypothetical protein [Tsuneonella troitsensis]
MRTLTRITALVALAAPLPALAQVSDAEVATAEVEATLKDPVAQAAIAEGMAAASEALLDIPLAPLAKAVAEAAGDNPDDVDPDMTLRSVSPDAQDAPDRVRESLPRVMGAMGSMAGGMGAMIPALREMADRMRAAVEAASPRY